MVDVKVAPLRVTDLRALRDKYERILRLRELHVRASTEPGFLEPDPRRAMAELASTFPGALREMDELPLSLVRTRIAELEAAEVDAERVATWMTAQARFHALARGALSVKRWLGGRAVAPAVTEDFAASLATLPHAEDARPWGDELAAIARPPRGRLMDLVYQRLARELGVDVPSARAAVLPPRTSLRGRGS
jgi:hypothetical protein